MKGDYLEQGISRHLIKCQIEKRDEILLLLNTSFPWTSRVDIFFANTIMFESIYLIKNSVIQFESGFFDAAMYSLRQAMENMNNTLFLSEDKDKLKSWIKKDRFPPNAKVLEMLEKQSENYKEIKAALNSWFDKIESYNLTANKYIHKQGFDTFYKDYKDNKNTFIQVNNFYNEYLKCTIAHLFVVYIAINPICLALSDGELSSHVHMDLLDDPLPIDFLIEVIGDKEFNKIKTTSMYISMEEYFLQFESLNYSTEMLMKNKFIDYERLDEINKQRHLLSDLDTIVLDIANSGIKASYVFFPKSMFFPYTTSIKPKHHICEYSTNMFDNLYNKQNILWQNMYCNTFNRYDDNDCIVLISNDLLCNKEKNKIKRIINGERQ